MSKTSVKAAQGINLYNATRSSMVKAYANELPKGTADNIGTISNILLDNNYAPTLNEFISTLVNRIGLTIVRNKTFTNPLQMFKKGSIPLGSDIQEIFTNPANRENYELSNTEMAKLLTITDPDTHVAYYQRNRKDMYTKTIAREALQSAFVSWEKFTDFVASITNSLYSGNYIDEFKYTKNLIDGAYANNKVVVEKINMPVDKDSAEAILTKFRELYINLTLPSSKYNAYSKFSGAKGEIITWTDKDRVCVILSSKVSSIIDVKALAQAFNIEYANFIGRVVVIDEFENPNILGVICDESWLQIYDSIFRFDEFYNARVMAWNEYLHAWGTFAISPFANAVVLATEEPNPATNITIGSETVELHTQTEPKSQTLEITLTPTKNTSNVTFTGDNDEAFTVEKVDNTHVKVTAVADGSGTLTAKTDNGLVATASITVTN